MEMELFDTDAFIPAKINGKHLDLEYSVTDKSVDDARLLYREATLRLLRPYQWHELAGMAAAGFNIFEKDNNIPSVIEIADRLLVKLTPVTEDWVTVEDIQHGIVKQADESIGIKLRPCSDTRNTGNEISHFFSDTATTTMIIRRIENVVTASYHGRNEKPNIHTADMADNIRNGIIAIGAIIGVSKIEWNALITGLLSNEK